MLTGDMHFLVMQDRRSGVWCAGGWTLPAGSITLFGFFDTASSAQQFERIPFMPHIYPLFP